MGGKTVISVFQEELAAFEELELRLYGEFLSSHDQPTQADFDDLWGKDGQGMGIKEAYSWLA
jgi:hypothetical protein